ncbi:hypothetical protein BD309DRAFT_878128 [Dichomitus squalens]|nr:hypothetical protein BD309DRAFT_878128 [Dichomitus squalens]
MQEFISHIFSICIEVEHDFRGVLDIWPFLYTFWKQCLHQSPVDQYYCAVVLYTNTQNCFHPNQIALCFNCCLLELEEYFHL